MDEESFDALFSGGSPLKKFLDVVSTANRNVCEFEIDKMFERFCALEIFCEEHGLDENSINSIIFNNQNELADRKNSLYLDVTAGIVTKAE